MTYDEWKSREPNTEALDPDPDDEPEVCPYCGAIEETCHDCIGDPDGLHERERDKKAGW